MQAEGWGGRAEAGAVGTSPALVPPPPPAAWHPAEPPFAPELLFFSLQAAGGLGLGWEMGLGAAQWGWRGLRGGDKEPAG